MYEQEYHEMVLSTTHPSGSEEWYCPTCGRRFLLRWPPTYEKIILEPGDEYAAHSGSKGEMLRLRSVDIVGTEAQPPADDLFAARPEQPLAAQDELPAIAYTPEAEELGEVPITDELQPWLKWLSSSDLDGPAGEPDRADQ